MMKTNGTGFRAEVSEIVGIGISRMNTSISSYEGAVFEWLDKIESRWLFPIVGYKGSNLCINIGFKHFNSKFNRHI